MKSRYYIVETTGDDAYLVRETTDSTGKVFRTVSARITRESFDFNGIEYLKYLVEAANHE